MIITFTKPRRLERIEQGLNLFFRGILFRWRYLLERFLLDWLDFHLNCRLPRNLLFWCASNDLIVGLRSRLYFLVCRVPFIRLTGPFRLVFRGVASPFWNQFWTFPFIMRILRIRLISWRISSPLVRWWFSLLPLLKRLCFNAVFEWVSAPFWNGLWTFVLFHSIHYLRGISTPAVNWFDFWLISRWISTPFTHRLCWLKLMWWLIFDLVFGR